MADTYVEGALVKRVIPDHHLLDVLSALVVRRKKVVHSLEMKENELPTLVAVETSQP